MTAIATGNLTDQGSAQSFPSRSLQLIVPFGPGGAIDIVARALSEELSKALGRPVIVENRAGGQGLVAATYLTKSDPSGHTLLLITSEILVGRFRPEFAPVGMIAKSPFVLVTSDRVRTLTDLIAGSKGGGAKFALTGIGSTVALDSLQRATGIKFDPVRFQNSAAAMLGVAQQEVNAGFLSPAAAIGPAREGKLRALGIASRQRLALMPEVPTLPELGLASAVFEQWTGLVAPKGTPAAVISVLSRELLSAINRPQFITRIAGIGFVPAPSTPQGFGEAVNIAGGVPICGKPCPEECRAGCENDCCTVRY